MAQRFTLKVNGTQFTSDRQVLSALEILTLAKEKGVIPGDPSGYLLQGEKSTYRGQDPVDLDQDSLFLTIPDTPTPVA